MRKERLEQAAYNNAVWCDTVCRAHGSPGEFLEGMWINRHQAPPFYPNAVTLAREPVSTQLACIQELVEAGIPGDWGVKDSYCALDLSSSGFRILFEAEWIGRPASRPRPDDDIPKVRWGRVTGVSQLAEWETAWRGEPAGEMAPNQGRIFLPPLLRDGNVAIIAAYRGRQIVAGAVASRTGRVAGASNLFVPAEEGERFRAGCIAQVIDAFPGLPLVGYEAGDDLAEMQELGFEALGPLRVWVKVSKRPGFSVSEATKPGFQHTPGGSKGMRVHHLNCGTLHLPLGVALVGTGKLLTPAPAVIHCLLVETDDGLLLVDTGFGTQDCIAPTPFMRLMMAMGGYPRDLEETAARQVKRLGYGPDDVRHIVLTHFHYDHAGGLPDFPEANVHILKDEYKAVTEPQDAGERWPYRAEHWSHGPNWVEHGLQGDRWFGFDCTPPVDLGSIEFCLVPLPGHTRGHSGVALRLPDGWLFHCGDAYTFHGDVDPENPYHPPYYRLIRLIFTLNKTFRQIGKHSPRLRALLRAHGDEVRLTCSHDPHDLDRFR